MVNAAFADQGATGFGSIALSAICITMVCDGVRIALIAICCCGRHLCVSINEF
jgi:hypothetical protein